MNRGENSGVVSVLKNCSYIVERKVDETADKVDTYVACNGYIFASALSFYLVGTYGEVSCGLLNYYIGGGYEAAHSNNVFHSPVYGLNIYLSVDYFAEGSETLYNAFDLAYVALYAVGNILNNIVIKLHTQLTGLIADYGHSGLYIGGLNVYEQTAFKAGAETVIQLQHIYGGTVGGDDYLMTGLVELIKGMEEFFLSCFLVGDELDIVNEEEIHISVFLAKLLGGALFYGADHFVGKIVALHIGYLGGRVIFVNGGANRQKEMCFSETGVSVYEKGVIGFAAGIFCSAQGGRVSVLIAFSYDKVIESVAVHLGKGVAVLDLVAVFVYLFAGKNNKLKIAGEKVTESGADTVAEALGYYSLLEGGGSMDNKFSFFKLNGSAVGKPGVYCRACKLTG